MSTDPLLSSTLWLGVPRDDIKESNAECAVDPLGHHNATVRDTLVEKLGGLPVVPNNLASYFLSNLNSLCFTCKYCKRPFYLVCQLKNRFDRSNFRVDYLFACNSNDCLRRIDAWENSVLCLSFEKSILQPNPPKRDDVKARDMNHNPIDGKNLFEGPLLTDCSQSLESLESLMNNLVLKIQKPAADATASSTSIIRSQKKENIKWAIIKEFSNSFPPVPVYFHEELSKIYDDSDDEEISEELDQGTNFMPNNSDSDEEELYEHIIPKQISDIFYLFERTISMNPLQVLRCGQSPLLAVKLVAAPKCAQCGTTLEFQWQVMPAFFHCIDVEAFSNEIDENKAKKTLSVLDMLKSNGMDWSTLLVYICPNCPPNPVPSATGWLYRPARIIIQHES